MTTTHEHSDHNATSVYILNGYRCQEKNGFFRQKRVYGKRKTPAINSPVRSFVVAIPLHHYKDSEIQTVNSLRERTIATNSIPTGWTHILGKNDEFVLCYVDKGRDGSSTQQLP